MSLTGLSRCHDTQSKHLEWAGRYQRGYQAEQGQASSSSNLGELAEWLRAEVESAFVCCLFPGDPYQGRRPGVERATLDLGLLRRSLEVREVELECRISRGMPF